MHAVGSVGHQDALLAKWSDSSPGEDAQEPIGVANWRKSSAGGAHVWLSLRCARGPGGARRVGIGVRWNARPRKPGKSLSE